MIRRSKSYRKVQCARHLVFALLAATVISSSAAQQSQSGQGSSKKWLEYDYVWHSLHISIRTDAGVFSPVLQNLFRENKKIGPFSHDKLAGFIVSYFLLTSVVRTDGVSAVGETTIGPLTQKWGPGHALPYIAAIAIQNIERPTPTIFSKRATMAGLYGFAHGGSVDVSQPGNLNFVIYSNIEEFHEKARQSKHSSERAYFDATRNEIGLALDMQRFMGFSSHLETDESRRILIIPAFISFVSDAFNDDCAHEVTHFIQVQEKNPAYRLPAIAEGEADLNGFYRSRTGLIYAFVYNAPEWWQSGAINEEQLQFRLKVLFKTTRPPKSPFEVQRLNELRALEKQGKRIPVEKLLSFGPEFYTGDASEVWSRYLYSWALCSLANSSDSSGELLRKAVAASVAGHPDLKSDAALDSRLKAYIADPIGLTVTKEEISRAEEDIFKQDESFAGIFDMWAYIADPTDALAVIYLADSLYKGCDFTAAEKYYREGLRLRPASALPYLRLGDIEMEAGNLAKAGGFWRRAEQTASNDKDEDMYRKEASDRLIKYKAWTDKVAHEH
jgi:hypothetical protein